MVKKWNYIGCFLDEESKAKLLDRYKYLIPKDWTIFAHHGTTCYNGNVETQDENFERFKHLIGKKVVLEIIGVGVSDKAVAVLVRNLVSDNQTKHITLATAPGVKPVESNNITDWYYHYTPVYVTGTYGYFANGQINFN